jgi:DNA-binding NarL/FixJ family response regulator
MTRYRIIQDAHGKAPEKKGLQKLQRYELGEDPPEVPLTKRQKEILFLASHGWRTRNISEALGIKPITVKNHWQNIFNKLNLEFRTRASAVATAIRSGELDNPREWL